MRTTCSFDPPSLVPGTAGDRSTLRISTVATAPDGTPAGRYSVTITGTVGTLSHAGAVTLTVE